MKCVASHMSTYQKGYTNKSERKNENFLAIF
jgi:hypothetical protein